MKFRIDFGDVAAGTNGIRAEFRFPKSDYTLRILKNELVEMNGAVIAVVAVWRANTWVSLTAIGTGATVINVGDLVGVFATASGCYWECDMSITEWFYYYFHYYITDFKGYQIRAWHILIMLIVLAAIILLIKR